MTWYFEQKNTFGKWTPRTSAERPDSRSANGGGREIRNVQEVPRVLEGVSLGALERHFDKAPVELVPAPVPPVNPWPDYEAAPLTLEEEGFRIETVLHYGAQMINDEGTVFAIKQDDLLRMMKTLTDPAHTITILANQVHADNVAAGWWTDLKTGEDLHGKRNIPEMLMLIVSEVSEAMEGHRKKLMDDKLPHRPMLRVELIDAVIRILDLLGSQDNDIHPAGTIFQEKRDYNAQRADHKPEARLAAGGKAF